MDAGLLRLIWAVVEETPIASLRSERARSQSGVLLRRIERQVHLSGKERSEVQQYLSEHQCLIQDLYSGQVM